MANQVDEDADLEAALKSKRAKGTLDSRLADGADYVARTHEKIKKEAGQSAAKRKSLYSKQALLPNEIVKQLPFKDTRKALKNEDKDALKEVLCAFVATIAEKTYTYQWPTESEG